MPGSFAPPSGGFKGDLSGSLFISAAGFLLRQNGTAGRSQRGINRFSASRSARVFCSEDFGE